MSVMQGPYASRERLAPAAWMRFLPLLAVDLNHCRSRHGSFIQAAHVDAVAIRMRAWNIERFDAAARAEKMLGSAGIELIGGQGILSGNEFEARGRDYEMQISRFAANGAVAS